MVNKSNKKEHQHILNFAKQKKEYFCAQMSPKED
jgi:hypothetical protein